MDGFKKCTAVSRAVDMPISATKSAQLGHPTPHAGCPLPGVKRKTSAPSEYFQVGPEADMSGLLLIVPDHASIAANVNDNCVFPLFAARFGCHHPREMTGGPPCAGVSRSGRCLLRGR